jgi:hypothetical protein
MINKLFKDGALRFGEGNISGYIACMLAMLSFLGVLAFHFPQYLITPMFALSLAGCNTSL